jgi:hypothetical protein
VTAPLPPGVENALSAKVRASLWRRGELRWKLHPGQQRIYDAIQSTDHKRVYLNVSRQWGKSTLLLLVAWELCLKNPGTCVYYWAPYGKDAEDIAQNKANWLLRGQQLPGGGVDVCPKDLEPEFRAQDRAFAFPNGSEIVFVGANNDRARFARGRTVHLHIVDEAAEVDDLDQLVNDVAMPSTLHTRGRIFLASTPARSPGHASTLMAKRCASEGKGAYWHFTIHDNPLLDAETIARYCREAGGAQSSTWRREYLADLGAIDEDTACIPELTDELRKEIVREMPRPPYFRFLDRYVAVDPGMEDFTGIVFGYWDPLENRFIAEDCLLLQRANTRQLAEAIKAKEAELWDDLPVFHRVVDDSGKRVVADLGDLGVSCSPAWKPDRDANIALLRMYVAGRQFLVSPRAEALANQLQFATRNPKTGDLERAPGHGHFDLVAASWYLAREVHENRHRQPIPAHWDLKPGQMVVEHGRPVQVHPIRQAVLGKTALGRRILRGG